ncbi:MAG: dephospho-CoA kinase [Thermodesulfovibrio sp.]|uniref:dephospho-CoA kinase n=1 Tax=unclassified Thermodesulfovibrio TaxID=2645936 RepID=UPI00083B0FBC|nr:MULTISPECIES: dephospho-CoA kinase [unclassified Thermodesulfovibrio]MDI1472760.1 dephospho-CoA kinase [Thermodesulfovibrio sp. 1176]MDI6713459.1 dephospho-CoA kinase [Thermodesulfovibrio sp.]ODA44498.1 Dephospho-CoA kinase [Thermodesulfovibrio sp. N1]
MIKVGLTGNYGMGKSTVAEIFHKLGAYVINTDKIVEELLEKKEIIEEIKRLFGEEVLVNGKLDKKYIAKVVFDNPLMRIYLENILHPRVFEKIDDLIKNIPKRGEPLIVVVEAPIIFERGYQNKFDIIITVYTPEKIAVERLKQKGISEEEVSRRLKCQFPIEMKKSKSDYIIDNSGSIEETSVQVEAIFQKLITLERKYAGN